MIVQTDAAVAPPGARLGLAPALVRAIVESHCRSVTALSAALGLNGRFVVRLPMQVGVP